MITVSRAAGRRLGWHASEFAKGVVIRLFTFHSRIVSPFQTFGFRVCFVFRASNSYLLDPRVARPFWGIID